MRMFFLGANSSKISPFAGSTKANGRGKTRLSTLSTLSTLSRPLTTLLCPVYDSVSGATQIVLNVVDVVGYRTFPMTSNNYHNVQQV